MECVPVTIEVGLWNEVGLEPGTVALVACTEGWPLRFEEEAARIHEACGDAIQSIEHVGGTSVPGIMTRPILDVMVGIEHLRDSGMIIDPLKAIGYKCHGENGVPGRRHFTRSVDRCCLVHIQMFPVDSDNWSDAISMRDRLRADPELARRYSELKQDLLSRFPDDPASYLEGRAAFEQTILA